MVCAVPQGISISVWQAAGNLRCDTNQTCTFPTGAAVLSSLDFHQENKWRNAVVLACLATGYRLLALVTLVVRAKFCGKYTYY
jgi:hypothetical protein